MTALDLFICFVTLTGDTDARASEANRADGGGQGA